MKGDFYLSVYICTHVGIYTVSAIIFVSSLSVDFLLVLLYTGLEAAQYQT